jgi:hypothetical protein
MCDLHEPDEQELLEDARCGAVVGHPAIALIADVVFDSASDWVEMQ